MPYHTTIFICLLSDESFSRAPIALRSVQVSLRSLSLLCRTVAAWNTSSCYLFNFVIKDLQCFSVCTLVKTIWPCYIQLPALSKQWNWKLCLPVLIRMQDVCYIGPTFKLIWPSTFHCLCKILEKYYNVFVYSVCFSWY